MSGDKNTEFAKIVQEIVALDATWSSDDPQTAETARIALGEIGKDLAAWAKRHGVTILRHSVESGGEPEVRRRCSLVTTTIKHGKIYICVLEGREGRNCFYSCAPGVMVPV